MNAELFVALEELEKEKNIPKAYMLDKIKTALLTAVKLGNAEVEIDEKKKEFHMYLVKEVVEEVFDPDIEISEEDAKKISGKAAQGDMLRVELKTNAINRITASTAKQVIIQGIRESERGNIYNELSSREHEIINAVITRIDPRTGGVFIEFGGKDDEKMDAVLTTSEQVTSEKYREGDHIKVYLVEVRRGAKGVSMLVSRTHPGLVKRLFELEVPEIHDGVVEIKNIAREAGSRTKIAVCTKNDDVDAIGACVGPRGSRVNNIVNELGGEKIDIVKYSDDPCEYVSAALSPSDVINVTLIPEEKMCRVVVPDDQLSLAIGKEGQNARLAAKLTGLKIDIKPASQPNA